jgi:hypothetical protein
LERYRKTGDRQILEILAAQGLVLRPGVLSDGNEDREDDDDNNDWVN